VPFDENGSSGQRQILSLGVSAHEFQQVCDRSVGFDRVPELRPLADHIVISPAYSGAFDHLGLLELGYDFLDRPLGDSNFKGNLPQ